MTLQTSTGTRLFSDFRQTYYDNQGSWWYFVNGVPQGRTRPTFPPFSSPPPPAGVINSCKPSMALMCCLALSIAGLPVPAQRLSTYSLTHAGGMRKLSNPHVVRKALFKAMAWPMHGMLVDSHAALQPGLSKVAACPCCRRASL